MMFSGTIPVEYFYVDDTSNGQQTHYTYTSKEIKEMVDIASKHLSKISNLTNSLLAQNLSSDLILIKLKKEDWLYYTVLKYKTLLVGRKVIVIGSAHPWVECLALSINVESVTTLEYNKLTYGTPDGIFHITTVSYEQFDTFYNNSYETFDIAFSLSSFDHDGLGRYGDPLNPNGDIEAMQKVHKLLKPKGLLFVTVPIGPDVVVFNLHRRYGTVRLPLLLGEDTCMWNVIDRVGWIDAKLNRTANWRQTYEPVFVLEKNNERCISNQSMASYNTCVVDEVCT